MSSHRGEHGHGEDCAAPAGPAPEVADGPRSRWKAVRDTTGAAVGAVLGIVPHVLHHIGLLAGAALITGASGNALLYAVGLLFSVPMLRRLRRRFGTPWAPAIAVIVFTGLFSLSAFVIGPAISDAGGEPRGDAPAPTRSSDPSPIDDHGHSVGPGH